VPVTGPNLALVQVVEGERKARGAYFTPPAIAEFLAHWAIHGKAGARVLDPTCGEGVFLQAAARELRALGSPEGALDRQVYGVDLHADSLGETSRLLESEGLDAHLIPADFFTIAPPDELFSTLGPFDAVVGNPPFVRYQQHTGDARRVSAQAALSQGVRLSGLASSWAALLVHAGAFLGPEGRLAMVLPAELLNVGYAEPVRRWLRERFAAVRLVLFETLQFPGILENVVLLLANGSGGCDSFSLYHVYDAEDLLHSPYNELPYIPTDGGKWNDLMLSNRQRQLFKRTTKDHFVDLGDYGPPELGTVTGANDYFAMSEATRTEYGLTEDHVVPISPPGTRHLRGLSFSSSDWEALRDSGEPVWLLYPEADDHSRALTRYVAVGEEAGIQEAYKCQVRTPWWRPPAVSAPDLFFTYMSHRYPRLVTNKAKVRFLNSMHGVRLRSGAPRVARDALPLLAFNSVTMLGAEIFGRSYGGGILKMEPKEAARLPMPREEALVAAWEILKRERAALDVQLRKGLWPGVCARVDQVLLRDVLKLSEAEAEELREAGQLLRTRRLTRVQASVPVG
jgi:adenine-specific DNA-methyltransferase